MTNLLLYTAGHSAAGRVTTLLEGRGATFTHAALERNGIIVEAAWPRVRALNPERSKLALEQASEVVQLQPFSPELDAVMWSALMFDMVGRPYSVITLLTDALAGICGFKTVVRLGGSVVCSELAAEYCRLVHDARVPSWIDSSNVTPADLGELFLQRRLPLDTWQQREEVSHG